MYNGIQITMKKSGDFRVFWLFNDGDYAELINNRWEINSTLLTFNKLYKLLKEDGWEETATKANANLGGGNVNINY